MKTAEGVYVFEVLPSVNKKEVMDAVEHVYKVRPVKVRMAKITTKKVSARRRGVYGTSGGGKKAYVYLKEGDSISII